MGTNFDFRTTSMKSQKDLIVALSKLPCGIYLLQDDRTFYFHPRIAVTTDGFTIRYERFFSEHDGRACGLDYMLDGEVCEAIAAWNFPEDCDFHKELTNFLYKLLCTFDKDELDFSKETYHGN